MNLVRGGPFATLKLSLKLAISRCVECANQSWYLTAGGDDRRSIQEVHSKAVNNLRWNYDLSFHAIKIPKASASHVPSFI